MNSSTTNLSARALASAELAHQRATGGNGLGDIAIYIQIRACHAMMNERLARMLAPYQLSNVGYFAMMMLYSRPENLANPSELCDATGETRGNMTRICDELVEKGWMQRVPNPDDRRRVDLSLSKSGMKLLNDIVPKLGQKSADFYKTNFSKAEKATLQQLLGQFAEALANSPV